MKVNLSKEAVGINDDGSRIQETIFGISLLNLMSETCPEDMFKHFGIDLSDKPTIVDVECTVNGVSVDLRCLIEKFWSSYNEDVNKRARELIEEKFQTANDMLFKIEQLMKSRFPVREDW